MRIKNVVRIIAVVGFITLSVSTSKMGAVKQRLAEVQSMSDVPVTNDNILPKPTLLTQVG